MPIKLQYTVASFPGPILNFSILHAVCWKIWEPGEEADRCTYGEHLCVNHVSLKIHRDSHVYKQCREDRHISKALLVCALILYGRQKAILCAHMPTHRNPSLASDVSTHTHSVSIYMHVHVCVPL